jgi:metal-dependent amidase/aminoacylase/carboxypeptidase family protein
VSITEQTDKMMADAGTLHEEQVVGLSPPSLAGEDFGWHLDRAPEAFAFIGCGNAARGITHAIHLPRFDLWMRAILCKMHAFW